VKPIDSAEKQLLSHWLSGGAWEVPALSTLSELGLAALCLAGDSGSSDIPGWGDERAKSASSFMQALARLHVEDPEIEEEIESNLATATDGSFAEILVRANVAWSAPVLRQLLDLPRAVLAVSMLAIEGEPEKWLRWLRRADDYAPVRNGLRAGTLRGMVEIATDILFWRESTADSDRGRGCELDAWLAALDPDLFARGLLRGTTDVEFFGEAHLLADLICARGPNSWLPTAMICGVARDEEALGLAGRMLYSASLELSREPSEKELLGLLYEKDDWEKTALALGLAVPLLLTDDDAWARRFVQAAVYESAAHQYDTDGMEGLPLSATTPANPIAAVESVLDDFEVSKGDDPGERVRIVRTLCDLCGYIDTGVEAVQLLERLESMAGRAESVVDLAALRVLSVHRPERVVELGLSGDSKKWFESVSCIDTETAFAADEGLVFLSKIQSLVTRADLPAARTVVDRWEDAPISRIGYLHDAYEVLVGRWLGDT
jgi:hypothetical protein